MRYRLRSLFSINPASLTLGTILLVITLFYSGPAILDLIELKTYDLRFLSRGDVRAVAVCLAPLRRLHLLPAVLPAVVAPEHP